MKNSKKLLLKNNKILFISSSRADYSLIKNTFKLFNADKTFNTRLCVTGTHLIKNFGNTLSEIYKDKIKPYYKIISNIENINRSVRDKEILTLTHEYCKILEKFKPCIVIILGDRFELLPLVYFTKLHNIKICHLHGGDKTIGSFDDTIRHSITKLSDFHFVINSDAKKRIIQLGENKKFIFEVGGFGIDNILNINFLSKKKIESKLNLKISSKLFIVTIHPDTKSLKTLQLVKSILISLNSFNDFQILFTSPNFDSGYKIIDNNIKKFCSNNKNAFYFKSLGSEIYLSLIKICSLVIGNSSSGILEVPYLKKITINIGNRQKGRVFGTSIINCTPKQEDIKNAINKGLKSKFSKNNLKMFSNKNTSLKTYSKIKRIVQNNIENPKEFHDIR